MNQRLNVVISGAQGYVGQELLALVNAHPYLDLVGIHGRQDNSELSPSILRCLKKPITVYSLDHLKQQASEIDVLLLATPANVSMEIASALVDSNILILDLSGAFRLPEKQFIDWYGIPHSAPYLIEQASYGLSPWIVHPDNTKLIANPGCYATCALITLLPLLKAKLIQPDSIIIDAKSGVSGAGKQAKPTLMFAEISNNSYPYKLGKHQHIPEICNHIEAICGSPINLRLSTSLLPMVRGISMSIYTEVLPSFSSDKALSMAVKEAFDIAYKTYPLIQYAEVGQQDACNDEFILGLKQVIHTPYTHIGYFINNGQLTLYSCLDNLLKGAASQAIETINTLFQLPIQTGLLAEMEEK